MAVSLASNAAMGQRVATTVSVILGYGDQSIYWSETQFCS